MTKVSAILKASIFGYTWRSRAIVLSVSVLCAIGGAALGLYLDKVSGHEGKGYMVLFLILSFPISQIIIRKLIMPKGDKRS